MPSVRGHGMGEGQMSEADEVTRYYDPSKMSDDLLIEALNAVAGDLGDRSDVYAKFASKAVAEAAVRLKARSGQ